MNKKTSIRLALTAAALIAIAFVVAFLVLRRDAAEIHDGSEPPTRTAAESSQTLPRGGLAAADVNGDGIVYQDAMHPWIVRDEPGTCPICGMDLTPVRVDEAADGSVRIDPATLQSIGVRTAPVRVEAIRQSVRTTGRFEANERQAAAVSPKISGWIETLHVNYEGARVAKGQPLLEVYSPELVSTQEEYLLALRNLERLEGTAAAGDAERLVAAAERRLAYWDISENQIATLAASKEPQKTLTLYAPASGTVVVTRAVEGQRVAAGETLMEISNLSTLWLMADVYEQDLAWVGVGTEALIELPYQPGTSISGRVDYIYDTLNPDTRSLKVRIPVSNPGLRLKPGMYATVTLSGGQAQEMPVVPVEAVVRTGQREVVILALGEGRFLPVDVVTGSEADGLVQVVRGLEGSETVVTSAQFLIDSEARLQSVVGSMTAGAHDHAAGDMADPGDRSEVAIPDGASESASAPAPVDPHAGH